MADFQKTKAIYEDGKIILTFKIHYCRDELGQRTNRGNLSPQTGNVRYSSLKSKPNVTQIPK